MGPTPTIYRRIGTPSLPFVDSLSRVGAGGPYSSSPPGTSSTGVAWME